MGSLAIAVQETLGHWPPSGLPMGQFRTSPYKGLSGKGPLQRYVVGISGAANVPDGCCLSNSCFTCVLPDCYYTNMRRTMKFKRDKELIRFRQEGSSIKELMLQFGLSRNTVSRILNKAKKEALHVNSG